MMQKLGELFVHVSAKGVEQVNAHLQTTEQKATLASKATNLLKTAIMMIGTYAVINGLRNVVQEFTNYTVAIDKVNKQTGIATEELQKLKYAAEQEHGSFEALEKGLMNLTVRLGYAGDGLATYTRYFNALGITYKNADGTLRNTYDVFMDIAEAASKGELSTEQLAAVMQLFGARSAKELIPMLKKGRRYFKEMGDEAESLGIVLEDKTIKAGKKFSDQLTKLNATVKGVKYSIANDLLPTLTELVKVAQSLQPLYDLFKKLDGLWQVNILGWKANLFDLRGQLENVYKSLVNLGIIKRTNDEMRGLGGAIKGTKKDFEELPPPIDESTKSIDDNTDAIEKNLAGVTRWWQAIDATRDRIRGGLLPTYEPLAEGLRTVSREMARAGRATDDASESFDLSMQFVSGLGNAFQGFNISLIGNAKAFHQWAQRTVAAIGMVLVKLLAMAAIVKTLEALGVPAGSLLKAMDTLGLYQTPSGDMSAYREGRDFGKFFMQGFGERFNNRINGLVDTINTGRQQAQVITVYAEPGMIVEKLSNMPTSHKVKFNREVTLKANRIE